MGVKLAITQFRVEIRDREHPPAHVHVIGPGGAEAVFLLDEVELKNCDGFSRSDVKMIREFIETNLEILMEQWHEIHG